jgi:hypothetical protein
VSVVWVGTGASRAPLRRVLDSAAGGRDDVTMTITTVTFTREDVAQARRARLERAGVTVHVSPWLLERARVQGEKLRGKRRAA